MSFETDFQRSSTLADGKPASEHIAPEPHKRRVMQIPERQMPGWKKVSEAMANPQLPDGFVDNDHDGMG
jgi:hypothetical protein